MEEKTLSVTVPFKESERWMYDIIACHSSKSAYIKDILAEHLREEINKEKISKEKINKEKRTNIDNYRYYQE